MKQITLLAVLALLCNLLYAAGETIEIGAGHSHSDLCQVLDDGRVALISRDPSYAGEEYLGGYLSRETTPSEIDEIFSAIAQPAFMHYTNIARFMVGNADGTLLWCVSDDQKNGAGDRIRKLHCYNGTAGSANSGAAFSCEGLILSEDGERAFVYGGAGISSQTGMLSGTTFTAENTFTLPSDNTGYRPAVATADFSAAYYVELSSGNLILHRYELSSGKEDKVFWTLGGASPLRPYDSTFTTKDYSLAACSADGLTVAFVFMDGSNGRRIKISKYDAALNSWAETILPTSSGSEPALSADGRYLAYVLDDGSLCRYDLLTNGTPLILTAPDSEWVRTKDTPMRTKISPNGRYVAYMDHDNRVFRIDCGAPEIAMSISHSLIGVHTLASSGDIGIGVHGGDDTMTISWNCADGTTVPSGTTIRSLQTAESIPSGSPVSVGTLPWEVCTGSESGNFTMAISLEDGENGVVFVRVHDFNCLTDHLPKNGGVYTYEDLSLEAAGRIGTTTAAPLSSTDVNGRKDYYLYDMELRRWLLQSALPTALPDGTLENPFRSFDDETTSWLDGNTLMVRFGSEAQPVALRTDVQTLCGMTGNGAGFLYRNTAGDYKFLSSYSASTPLSVSIPSNAAMVTLSANGRRISYTSKSANENIARLYILDLPNGTPRCLTPETSYGVLSAAVSADGKYVVFSTYADMLTGGTSQSANELNNLYLWTDTHWRNTPADALVTAFPEILEDAPEKRLVLSLRDAENDAIGVRVTTSTANGTMRLERPDTISSTWRLFYKPAPDFHGTDAFAIEISDGTDVVTRSYTLTIVAVNDPPRWDFAKTGGSITVQVGAYSLPVPLVATDPDGDTLIYSVAPGEPSWATVTTSDNIGQFMVSKPGFQDIGVQRIQVVVSDGMDIVPLEVQVTVTSPSPVPVTVALLRDASLAPNAPDPRDSSDFVKTAVAGCWQDLPAGVWQALSLPCEVDIAQLCAAIGNAEIYCYDETAHAYLPISAGTLPAGRGFWAAPVWGDASGELTLTPAPRGQPTRFEGPVWTEEAPDPATRRYAPISGAWRETSEWSVGRAYFRSW